MAPAPPSAIAMFLTRLVRVAATRFFHKMAPAGQPTGARRKSGGLALVGARKDDEGLRRSLAKAEKRLLEAQEEARDWRLKYEQAEAELNRLRPG